ncbi:MAG TPA: M1 family metallopeptidase, partial [Nevskiaceae bacterium]|nr:M1 family metallopeptidase [Nevskiaceae bacterium]
MRAALAAMLLWWWASSPALAQDAAPIGELPRTAEPLSYQLHFILDPQADGYTAEASIRVRLHQAADHLWLHGRSLTITQAQWTDASGTQGSAQYQQVNDDGVARVDFGRELAAQDLTLSFQFSGRYNRTLEGIYKVSRGGDDYLVTQLEAIAAREVFPCFDQPSFKTPFDLSLTVPEKLVAVANSRQVGDERAAPGSKTLQFATTAPLPTYLLAFAVGPWEVSELSHVPADAQRKHPLQLRVIGPRGSRALLDYALKTTPAIVAELENYFGEAYPFDKLDLLAAPDFAFGAMENAGLIVYRESELLLDARASVETQQDYYLTNAHELAHQWFGNDVTLRWWDDTWLNESFASWMEGKIVDRIHPEWHAGVSELQTARAAMEEDSLISARRIREPIVQTSDIDAAFDNITSEK